nr:MAG TPA_asm: YLP motif protein [Bacteriophage sp.]
MKNNKYLPPFGGVLILVSIINGLNFQINNNFR